MRKQWQEIWDKCVKDKPGQLPGKTIVFAMTQDHALRLEEVFNEMFPQFPGLVRTITYKSDYKGQLITKFKKESLSRIAITVDLLETGIDVPEVVNLVFMRPVQSRIKLWQMIGRGTRSQAACQFFDWLPDGEKKEFIILDFWENDFNKSPEKEAAQSLPVLVSLFNTRLNLLEHYLGQPTGDEFRRTVADLRAQVALIPTDSFSVKKIYPDVEEAWRDEFWAYVNPKKVEFLRNRVGPLLRYAVATDVAAATFTNKIERLKFQSQTGHVTATTIASIRDDVGRLKDTLLPQPAQKAMKDFCLSPDIETAAPAQLDQVADTLASLMKNKSANPDSFLMLDLKDAVALSGYILLKGGTEKIYVTDYRERVEKRILELMTHPIIDAISRGEPVSDERLIELERTLRQTLGEGDLELVEANIRKAFGVKVGSLIEFVRQILELDGVPDYAEIVRHQFSEYVAAHPFNADQTRFLTILQNVFIQKRRVVLADLYDPPLSNLGQDAVERWFSKDQVDEVMAWLKTLEV